MVSIIIGNILSLFATVSDSISSTKKTFKSILLIQTVSQVFYTASGIVLKGYSAAVQNGVNFFRNLFAIQGKRNKFIEWFFILIAVVLGIYFNNRGFVGLLPVIANFVYSIAVFRFQDNGRALKTCFLFTVTMFTIFNLVILNFVGFVANCVLLATTAISLIRDYKKEKKTCT